jgi:hypothetical protein
MAWIGTGLTNPGDVRTDGTITGKSFNSGRTAYTGGSSGSWYPVCKISITSEGGYGSADIILSIDGCSCDSNTYGRAQLYLRAKQQNIMSSPLDYVQLISTHLSGLITGSDIVFVKTTDNGSLKEGTLYVRNNVCYTHIQYTILNLDGVTVYASETAGGSLPPEPQNPHYALTYGIYDNNIGSIGLGTDNPDGRFDVAASLDSSKKILTLKENTTSGQECFEIQSINGNIVVVPRVRTSAGINAAISYLQNNGDKGGKVFLPGGDPFDIDVPVNIGEYDGTSGEKKCGHGIQIIGAGVQSTILRIISTNANGISAIKINGGQDSFNTRGAAGDVVIKDLQITIAKDSTDKKHLGIENDFGCNVFIQNVMIKGNTYDDLFFYCGIKSLSWDNLYQFCMIYNCWYAHFWLTSATSPTRAANSNGIVNCSIGIGNPTDMSTDVYGILVEDGVTNQIVGCTFNSTSTVPPATGKAILIQLGTNTKEAKKTSIMYSAFEGGNIGIKIKARGNTIIGNMNAGVADKFIDLDTSGNGVLTAGNIIMGTYNINTVSTDPTFFGASTWGSAGDEAVLNIGDNYQQVKAVHHSGLNFQTYNDVPGYPQGNPGYTNAFRWKSKEDEGLGGAVTELMTLNGTTGMLGINNNNPQEKLDVIGHIKASGNVRIGSSNAFYLGDPTTTGSWRIIRDGSDLKFQKYNGSTWDTKQTITG